MKLISIIIFCFSITRTFQQNEKCYSIKEGWHYPSLIPFNGFNSKNELFSLIKFEKNAASYLFKNDDPNGRLCTNSWNKLFGTSRCNNYLTPHQDSDRFVWRRSQKCVSFNGQYLLGENSNCDELDLIEIAAYTYDNGDKPFQNQGRLLKEFKNKIKIDLWYGYRLRINQNNTQYELLDSNGNLLESVLVEHRDCGISSFNGSLLGFYFGGQCPAPQAVTACYNN